MSAEFDDDIQRAASDRHKARGFVAGESVHEFTIGFSKEELQQSLFESTYSNPIAIRVELEDCDIHLEVVVTIAKQVYTEYTNLVTDGPLGCFEEPEWYLEGWVRKSGFDPYSEVIRVRAYLLRELISGYIQRIATSPHQSGLIATVRRPV